MTLGFARDKRLLTSRQFQQVFGAPIGKVSDRHLLLLAQRNDLLRARLGLVIGKKNVKLAVQRNRLKRMIRESFRLNQQRLSGWDLVLVARKGLGDLPNPELQRLLAKLWDDLARSQVRWSGRKRSAAVPSHA